MYLLPFDIIYFIIDPFACQAFERIFRFLFQKIIKRGGRMGEKDQKG